MKAMRQIAVTLVLIAAPAAAQAAAAKAGDLPDGRLLATAACEGKSLGYPEWLRLQEEEYDAARPQAAKHGIVMRPFAELREALPAADEFRERRAYQGFTCERIVYASDGLKVVGYIWRPADVEGKQMPLIIFNRGGGQDLGKLVPWERDGFYDYLKSGFVVIGSQYRGNDDGEGHDEEGGAEVRDVVNLLALARSLGYLDMRNVFMMGDSRGAMMIYLAMRDGVKLRAAAVVGAETDLAANLKRRPELREGYRKHIPGFAARPTDALRRRSAVHWPESISAPLLMMHGGNDWRVPVAQDLTFALRLEALRKPYELRVFEGDVHQLTFNWKQRDRATIDWFQKYMAAPASPVRF